MSNDKSFKDDRPIWLTSLADADRGALPSAGIEERLARAVGKHRRRILLQRMGTLALAASFLFVCWKLSNVRSMPNIEFGDDAVLEAMNEASDGDSDFVPTNLAGEQPLEAVRVVRVSMPQEALAKYGVSATDVASTSSSNGEVTADLLVGQDGIARAIRVVK